MDYLINLITTVGYWGYGILFLIIFLESFPPTFFLPGDSLLFLTGFLASQGHFNIVLLVVTFFSASVLGYMFSYEMGEILRNFILKSNDRYWFKKKHLEYTEDFYQKYGTKAIILSRFVPIVRSFSPTLAGAVKMEYRKFRHFSMLGGMLWTGGITLLGFFLGRRFPGAHNFLAPIIISIIFVSLAPAVFEFLRKRLSKKK